MAFTIYNGIPCECPCGAKVSENNASMTRLWSNQHGTCIRIFCHVCGQWSDRKMTAAGESIHTFTPVIPHGQYVEHVMNAAPSIVTPVIETWKVKR